MRRPSIIKALLTVTILTIGAFSFYKFGRSVWHPAYLEFRGVRTVADVIDQYGERSRVRLVPAFAQAGVVYPPDELALLGLKAERSLEVWALSGDSWSFIKSYPIKGASGNAGPKLREGDRQVPEGIYRIIGLNPNSSYHLSMKLNYPNEFELQKAKAEGRSQPGSNIFVHGKTGSVGCLAMGDEAIEELFTLIADAGKDNVKVVIAPHDPRATPLPNSMPDRPIWLSELYGKIEAEFKIFSKGKTIAPLLHQEPRE